MCTVIKKNFKDDKGVIPDWDSKPGLLIPEAHHNFLNESSRKKQLIGLVFCDAYNWPKAFT